MSVDLFLPIAMFLTLFVFILSGFPVAFTLGGTAILFALIGHSLDIFSITDFAFIPSRVYGLITNFTLAAVPLFIFMGITLEKSGVAEELLENLSLLLKRINGGLLIAVVVVGAVLAASTGIVGATVVTMSVISLPAMLKRGYSSELASGAVAASGTLGQIIPPSIVLILLSDIMNLTISDVFAAALLPGLLLVSFYILYLVIRIYFSPHLAPAEVQNESIPLASYLTKLGVSIVPPLGLMVVVLGSILLGLASPTEAAACGALGALIIAFFRSKLSPSTLRDIMDRTTSITAMVFILIIGAQFFIITFRGLHGDDAIAHVIQTLDMNPTSVLFFTMLIIFVLGFFLDFLEICFIVVPVITPLLVVQLGVDPLWLAILIAINLQTSFLTPPFGFALFYMKGSAPPELKTWSIYKGILPFVGIQLLMLFILWFFPQVVTWLPEYLFSPG